MTNLQRITISAIFALSIPAYLSANTAHAANVSYGSAWSVQNVGGNVARVIPANGTGVTFVDESVLSNKNLSQYPIYGCAKVGYSMNITNANGFKIGVINPTKNYGYRYNLSSYGFSVDFRVSASDPAFSSGLWNVSNRKPLTYFDKNDVLRMRSDWDQFIMFYAYADNSGTPNVKAFNDTAFWSKVCGSNMAPVFNK
ncbi:hypothetical protein [Marinobacterium iners]|uniref:hypothetical protein n=1 Tax=Marinobacterium iners TaxID=48076 RepID=UPI001A90163A|nr:hypothetical protein [Marinobacterium iners]